MSPPARDWQLRGRANFRSRSAPAVDALRARKEWLGLADALVAAGGQVVVLPAVGGKLTGLPYAAEAGHALGPATETDPPRFILPRMLAAHRQAEADHWRPFVEQLGFETYSLPVGIWEGQGDVAWFRDNTLLFFGGRTDRPGLDAVRGHFSGEVMALELRQPAFHGNMALLPLPAVDRLLVCREVFVGDSYRRLEDRFGRESLILVSENEIRSYATNGLALGNVWIVPSVAPKRVVEEVQALGMRIVWLKMKELCEKAGGACRCLVCHVPGMVLPKKVPDEYCLESTRSEIDVDE